ncbi:MAG: hypothetical protein BYD32DRAFT_449672 [Podila humilis]|nr:MAG: hypothetical protein BYD32DRAFT_449672 [Podila humilis]
MCQRMYFLTFGVGSVGGQNGQGNESRRVETKGAATNGQHQTADLLSARMIGKEALFVQSRAILPEEADRQADRQTEGSASDSTQNTRPLAKNKGGNKVRDCRRVTMRLHEEVEEKEETVHGAGLTPSFPGLILTECVEQLDSHTYEHMDKWKWMPEPTLTD